MAKRVHFSIDRGTTFKKTIFHTDEDDTPLSLANHTARMHIRKTRDAADPPDFALTDSSGLTIEAGGETGRIDILLTEGETRDAPNEHGVYDLEVVGPNPTPEVSRVAEGAVLFRAEVTR